MERLTERSMETSISSFIEALASFLTHADSTMISLTKPDRSRPIHIDSAIASFLRQVNSCKELELLESVLSSDELLGHCNEVYKILERLESVEFGTVTSDEILEYKMHRRCIRDLEDRLVDLGYCPPSSPGFLDVEIDDYRRKIRNICIVAHVDHGKTTLADHLIASSGNGIIHPKLAGKLRFMDYLDEEQRRAITMKSSSILLKYGEHSINLIDSPGHIDFCSEVSTAARLSDGALVLVDSVEGVHIQTHAALRQAWIEKLTPCLVLNKIDRLITELKLSPMEAYMKLQRIIHDVNGIVSGFKSVKYLSDVDLFIAGSSTVGEEFVEEEDNEADTFQPQKGNVVFVCALDGWGFGIAQFAEMYASKLGASSTALNKGLWGLRYFNHKTKMIVGKKAIETSSGGKEHQPMFVQLVLKPIWQVYMAALDSDEKNNTLAKLVKTFNLSIPPRDLNNKNPKIVLQAVMSKWLPLSNAVLKMVVECMPDPISALSHRISHLLPRKEMTDGSTHILAEAESVRRSVEVCDSSKAAPCVAFVSKMFAVPYKMLPREETPSDELQRSTDSSDECFLAFARIFSGVLMAGQNIFVLSALYDPSEDSDSLQKHLQVAELDAIYLMMGQGLKAVPSATAGNVVAIRGLGQYILKSATLSSTRNCWPFSSMMFQVSPTLRVAIEPSNPEDSTALLKGMRLLNRADPFVEVSVSARGEQVLAAAGEVHLERCIKDLKERFAKVNLKVSDPLVSYRETVEGGGGECLNLLENLKMPSDCIEKITPNGRCVVRMHAIRLPDGLTKVLEENSDLLRNIVGGRLRKKQNTSSDQPTISENKDTLEGFKKKIFDAIESEIESAQMDKDRAEKYRSLWLKLLQRIWALGPGHVGPNILLVPDNYDHRPDNRVFVDGSSHVSLRLGLLEEEVRDKKLLGVNDVANCDETRRSLNDEVEGLKSSIVSGFQLASSAGPLCDEPMWGMAFLLEAYILPEKSATVSSDHYDYGIFAGQVMTTVKEACRSVLLQNKPRIVEGMYFCDLITPTKFLGPMHAFLGGKRARILKQEMQEGCSLFTVHAYIPVAESFGFTELLRKSTSGASSCLLMFSHWEVHPEDPFFIPKTEDEIEEFGDGASILPNTARKLIDAVRYRKGLSVEEKVVQHATKQRTLARKV
ncbi:Elongation factor Tu family protein [Zostera marina]|uniref:Elongation factor-like 1 n=1 Tax=Zostera marina TaxID=29655 RepID=A0A0K9PF09_ZOSMR|nr:Elongation factor Tu family protein [Zostera marina]